MLLYRTDVSGIEHTRIGRGPGGDAIALVEVDGMVPPEVLAKVQALPQVKQDKSLVF